MAEESKEAAKEEKKVICDTCEELEVEPENLKKGGKTCQTCINKGAKKKTPTKATPEQPKPESRPPQEGIRSPLHTPSRKSDE